MKTRGELYMSTTCWYARTHYYAHKYIRPFLRSYRASCNSTFQYKLLYYDTVMP